MLQRVLSKTPSPISTVLGNSSERFRDLPVGSTIEVSPTAFRLAHKIGQLLSTDTQVGDKQSLGGSGLIIDYGGDQVFEDSFRVRYFSVQIFFSHISETGFPQSQTRRRLP